MSLNQVVFKVLIRRHCDFYQKYAVSIVEIWEFVVWQTVNPFLVEIGKKKFTPKCTVMVFVDVFC